MNQSSFLSAPLAPAGQTLLDRILRLLQPPRTLRFTAEGRNFTIITLVVGFAAVNTGNNLLYLMLGLMLSTIVLSGILSEQMIRRLAVKREIPPRIFAGEETLIRIAITSGKRVIPTFAIEAEDVFNEKDPERMRRGITGWILEILRWTRAEDLLRHGMKRFLLHVPAGETRTIAYKHVFPRRGPARFAAVSISTRFPFAFFRKARYLEAPGEALVWPAKRAAPEQFQRWLGRQGEVSTAEPGAGLEFHSLRPFRPGDDARAIHWKSFARRRKLMTREFEREQRRRLTICVNNECTGVTGPSDLDSAEEAIALAASIASWAIGNNYETGLCALGLVVDPAAGEAHLTHLMNCLARLDVYTQRPAGLAWRFPPEDRAGSLVLISPSAASAFRGGPAFECEIRVDAKGGARVMMTQAWREAA
ncbi:MAG: hypothetical protein GMKNLPBB_02432 [Myxococcota bacterium]|nr:hypothetical protein [Myxococcota bacterium]